MEIKTCQQTVNMLSAGLYKLFHPAVQDGRTWSNLGEHGGHGERGEHWQRGKDGKHQPDYLKHSKCSICQPDDSKHPILQHLRRRLKNHNMRAWRA